MKRIAALLTLMFAVAAFSGIATSDAKALYPYNQTSVTSTVNLVYSDLVEFWRLRVNPTVSYYDNGYADYWIPCNPKVWTRDAYGWEGLECGGRIYLDYYQQVGNIKNFGDGAVAFWLAHEFGHHVEEQLGINWNFQSAYPYHELLADCFAGMYFRYGVWDDNGVLNVGDDWSEARTQIWALINSDDVHGTRQQRLNAFDYGFTQTHSNGCITGAQSHSY